MSQRAPAQGPPSGYEHVENTDPRFPASTSLHQYESNTAASSSVPEGPLARFGSAPSHRGVELPPLLQVPGGSTGRPSPSVPRSVNLPSVLNPVTEEASAQGQRRRKADELDSPRGQASALPSLFPSLGPPSVTSSSGASPLYLLTEPTDRFERPRATPHSPMRRAISMSQLGRSTGSINAGQNPFPASPLSRPYAFEPGRSGIPSLPTPPAGLRQNFGFPSIVQPNEMPQNPSPDYSARTRYSASPSPGYSSYSPGNSAENTSPTATSSLDQSGYLAVNESMRGSGRNLSVPPASSGGHYSVPITAAGGQSTYQLMTLKTTEGDVRFPVDVQAASRVADEKRKRNAGASARFRERRKKKEVEASVTIAKLEQQIKNIAEDAEFYKRERDTFATIVHQMPGGERHFPRPQSPRMRRNASGSTGSMRSQRDDHSPDTGRNVRRRTSSFPTASTTTAPQAVSHASHTPMTNYAPPPPPVIPQAPHSQQYLPLHPSAPAPPVLVHPMAHGLGHLGTSLPPPPPPVMQAQPMTGPYNPFAGRFDSNNPHRQSHGH